ncbi:MAG: potassium-transporting ATPase subunit KdpC [Burkholderiales bacterium]
MAQLTLQALRALIVLTVVTGALYPLIVTHVAQFVFPHQANGSLVRSDDTIVGSELIGQPFSDRKYFWSRPSATSPMPYNGGASSGSNQGPLNPAHKDAVADRIKALREAGADPARPVPIDLVTASGSGLDPHISPAAAEYQAARVAKARNLPESRVRELIAQHTQGRQLGVLGEPRVNVLKLNFALERAQSK